MYMMNMRRAIVEKVGNKTNSEKQKQFFFAIKSFSDEIKFAGTCTVSNCTISSHRISVYAQLCCFYFSIS